MAASAQINIGSAGIWQIIVTQVSQNTAANTSVVRVQGVLYNTSGSRSFNNSNIAKSIGGEDTWSSSGPFDVAGNSSQIFIDVSFTVPHGADGTKTVTYGVGIGATGTSTFGSGGSVGVSLALTRIPKVPAQMTVPSRTFTAPTTVRVSYTAPNNNGSAILEYIVQADDNVSFSSPSTASAGTALFKDVVGLTIGKTWWFRVRARNAVGTQPLYSSATTYAVPDVPGDVPAPTLVYTPPTVMDISWTAPASDGGAAVTGYDLQYSDTPDFSGTVLTKSVGNVLTTQVTDLVVGKTWYFQVRAKNTQGVANWSASGLYLVVCGPRIRVASIWKNTVAYVRMGGVWKVAIPYVKVAGTWKIAGG